MTIKCDADVSAALRDTLATVDLRDDNGLHIATMAQCMIYQDERLGRIESKIDSVDRKVDLLTDDVREVLSHNMVLIDALKRGEGLK